MTLFYALLETLPTEEHDFLENLYETYKYKIKKMALTYVKKEYDAEDILQIVAVNIVKNVSKFMGKEKKDIESQIVIYTRYASINYCKKLRRQAYYENRIPLLDEEEDLEVDIPDGGPGVEELILNEETADRVRKVMTKLKENHRDVLNLYYGMGYSYEEIGQILGTSTSSVGTRLSRAKHRLAELWIKEGEETIEEHKK